MTRAGEKLYRDDAEPQDSVFWAFITHPIFLRGAWDMVRLVIVVALVAVLFGLG